MSQLLRPLTLGLTIVIWLTAAAVAAPRSYSLQVDGLVCPLCAYSAKRNLGAIDGVEEIEIDYRTGKATVTMSDGAVLDETEARAAIDAAGFTLLEFEEADRTPQE